MRRALVLAILILAMVQVRRDRAPPRGQLRIRGHVGASSHGALILAVMAACGFRTAPPPALIDARAPEPDAYQCVHVRLDAGDWGAPCTTTQTSLCHGDLGWCINGTCRPMCVQPLACLACEGMSEHQSGAGQCYCAP